MKVSGFATVTLKVDRGLYDMITDEFITKAISCGYPYVNRYSQQGYVIKMYAAGGIIRIEKE